MSQKQDPKAELDELLEKGRRMEATLSGPLKKKKKKNEVHWRKRDSSDRIVPQRTTSSQSSGKGAIRPMANAPVTELVLEELSDRNLHLQQLQSVLDTIGCTVEEESTFKILSRSSDWNLRHSSTRDRWNSSRTLLLDGMLMAEDVSMQTCCHCGVHKSVIRCADCLPKYYLCPDCDLTVHKQLIMHNREVKIKGFYQAIPPTSYAVKDDPDHIVLRDQACLLPIPLPDRICSCKDSLLTVTAGRSVILITINGRYDLSLPCLSCSFCRFSWTPGVKDLLVGRYWPATLNFQTVYALDVFSSYEEMKTVAPALSRLAFVRMLEQRSLQFGRIGKICHDTFQRTFLEYSYTRFEREKMCAEQHFACPACTPDMLAVSVDGNRKHYRFRKSKGSEEEAHYTGVFLAEDKDVSAFVDLIRIQMTQTQGSATCGRSTWTAAKETSKKASSKVDEEGIEVAVCRHGVLLKGLNMFRGEIFAYPMFLQKELAVSRKVSFFCTDVMCRYWPYLCRVTGHFPELSSLMQMKPFLSVLHAKAHDWKCEIVWGGRNQEGSGTTIGEEVEQVNSFLSRVALTTKYMTKAARNDMITVQAMGWNSRKIESLHKTLSQRYNKTTLRAKAEADGLQSFMLDLNCSPEEQKQWVADVKQWAQAVTEEITPDSPQDLQKIIEGLFGSLREKKHNLYRQNDSNKQRQRKRRHLSRVKAKLIEAMDLYNSTVSDGEKIDVQTARDSDENFVWPWENSPNESVSLSTKRKVFDKVMLISRLQEEESILVKEMTQHCLYLHGMSQSLKHLIQQTTEDIRKESFPFGLSKEGSRGLLAALLNKLSKVESQQAAAKQAYNQIVIRDPSVFSEQEEEVMFEDEEGSVDTEVELEESEGELC